MGTYESTISVERYRGEDGEYLMMDAEGVPEDAEVVELEVEISGSVDPYDPGRAHGLPEDCYPPEGGVCEDLVATLDGKPFELTSKEGKRAEEVLEEQARSSDECPDSGSDRDYDRDDDRDYGGEGYL